MLYIVPPEYVAVEVAVADDGLENASGAELEVVIADVTSCSICGCWHIVKLALNVIFFVAVDKVLRVVAVGIEGVARIGCNVLVTLADEDDVGKGEEDVEKDE